MNAKQAFAVAAAGVMAFSLAACGGSDPVAKTTPAAPQTSTAATTIDTLIGVSMPTETSDRWTADGNAVRSGLEDVGYKVDLEYAGDDIPTQSQQIDKMIRDGADVLIIAAIDGTALSTQLDAASAAGIKVIAYDRLIKGSAYVDFYVTFDNYKVGVQQATSLLVGLGLLNQDGTPGDATGPFNIEIFSGSLDDNNAYFFFDGALATLKPYIDAGTLVVRSGETDIDRASTLRWSQDTAQARMDRLLASAYADGTKVDGVLSPFDGISRGVIASLLNAGYSGTAGKGFPIATGQDSEIASVKLVADGVQYASIFKDTRKLAAQAIVVTQAILGGTDPEANDTKTYDNGVKTVPSYLLSSDIVYRDTITPLLVDSGYWTAEEVASGVAG